MRRLTNILDRVPVDNKLIASLAALIATHAAIELLRGGSEDRLLRLGLPVAAAGLIGYQTHNEGSILRRSDDEDGNPALPEAEAVPGELTVA